MSDPAPIITLRDLASALNRERMRQGMKLIELDHVAGLQSGYSAKIVANMKRLGELSLPGILKALNLQLQLAPCKLTAEQLETNDCEVIHREDRKKIASAGGKARAMKLSPARRREIASKAGRERGKKAKLQKSMELKGLAEKKISGSAGDKSQGELF